MTRRLSSYRGAVGDHQVVNVSASPSSDAYLAWLWYVWSACVWRLERGRGGGWGYMSYDLTIIRQ